RRSLSGQRHDQDAGREPLRTRQVCDPGWNSQGLSHINSVGNIRVIQLPWSIPVATKPVPQKTRCHPKNQRFTSWMTILTCSNHCDSSLKRKGSMYVRSVADPHYSDRLRATMPI